MSIGMKEGPSISPPTLPLQVSVMPVDQPYHVTYLFVLIRNCYWGDITSYGIVSVSSFVQSTLDPK